MTDPSTRTVLLTLGRLPVALDVARSFHAAGWRVVVAEPFAFHLCRTSKTVARCYPVTAPARSPTRYLEDLQRIIDSEQVTLVVPISEESIHAAGLTAHLHGRARFFGMPQPGMLALHDKYRFVRLAESFGLQVPRTFLADDTQVATLIRDHDYVVKPRYSCSGRGVTLHSRGSRPPTRGASLIQQRLQGQLLSSFSIARDGRTLATVVYQGVVMSGSVAVCFTRISDAPTVERWVEAFIEASGHTGFIAFDFIVNSAGQPAAIECNPRATSGIHFIDADALAGLITGPTAESVAGSAATTGLLKEDPLLAESYSCYTATLGAIFRGPEFSRRLQCLRRSRDVTWCRQDPWPFLSMMLNTYRILARSIVLRRTFAEVANLDLEWREPDQQMN